MGHNITNDGLKIDETKTNAITAMPSPSNVSELRTLLGMVNYLAKFIPNLSDISTPLR